MSQPVHTNKDCQENEVVRSKKGSSYRCKKFQEETAIRIVEMFKKQPRVLLADEVGLGKTIVAREVIKLLNERKLEENKRKPEQEHENLKVFYYCSNMTLASQNQAKLSDEFNDNHEKSISVIDQRLSMVHWLIAPHKDDAQNQSENKKDSAVILYQTPQTSLENGRRQGVVYQRALMYVILKDFFQFRGYNTLGTMAERLCHLLVYKHNDWDRITKDYEDDFEKVRTWYRKEIYSNLKDKMKETFLEQENLLDFLKDYLNYPQYRTFLENYDVLEIIKMIRVVFAQISIDRFNPDLVILDEFQRYDDLIDIDKKNENLLFDSMINKGKTKVLLLSATPYTPYTMKADSSQNKKEDHYKEFMNLIQFLKGEEKFKTFKDCWEKYSDALNQLTMESLDAFINEAKADAEEQLYSIICRTERRNDKNIIKQNDYSLNITEKDVLSWINIKNITSALSDNVEADNRIIDYVKSSPYLLSFMGKSKCNYSIYEKIQNYYKSKRGSFPEDKTSFIPVKDNESFKYGDFNLKENNQQPKENKRTIQTNNARLQLLIDTILPENKNTELDKHTELLLWVPASQPYYDASSQKGSGVKHPVGDIFSKNKGFSKILVFSHWTMVPPMTSAMVSFEADRRIFKNGKYNIRSKKNKRRLIFSIGEDTRNLLAYPSKKLADIDIYKLVQNSENKTLDELALKVSEVIKNTILKPFLTDEPQQQKAVRWSLKGYLAFLKHLDSDNNDNSDKQISVPQDAAAVLAWLAIASPGVCALRTLNNRHWTDEQTAKIRPEYLENNDVDGNNANNEDDDDDDDEDDDDLDAEKQPDKNHDVFKTAQEIASSVVSIFNHDSQKLIENAFKNSEIKNAVMCKSYAFRVVRYCAEGNLQAVMDELAFQCQTSKEFYDHFVYKIKNNRRQQTDGSSEETDVNEISQEDNNLRSCLAPRGRITVQTRNSFLYPKSKKHKPVVFRTGFALALSQTESSDQSVMHSERIRKAFNSPFRPFVLSTTSIGQDGLDFHAYCRKVMHWNLPGNPIDLEQREGRINRFLSLAIRQSLANSKYADEILQKGDSQNTETPSTSAHEADASPLKEFWKKLVDKVALEDNNKSGEMVPYWILPEDFEFKYPIERIVPMYPHSKDQSKYEWIINILSKYRLTLGQPNQEELIDILGNIPDDRLKDPDLYFNLSPFFRNQK